MSTKSALVEFIAAVKSLVPVNSHQSGDSRAMLATANSGKTFHSEIRLIQPPGATARKVSPAFPFFEIRREAIQRGEGSPALNCKFDPDRSSALSRHQPSIRSYPQRRIRATSRSTILPSFYLLFPVALCRLEKLIGDRID